MQEVSVRAYWSWNIINDKGEKCFTIDDLCINASCKTNATDVNDMTIESVMGDFAERTGLAWVHHTRELPKWFHDVVLAAANKEIENSDSTLYQSLVEAAQEEYYALRQEARESRED